jgi:hypothetical protein
MGTAILGTTIIYRANMGHGYFVNGRSGNGDYETRPILERPLWKWPFLKRPIIEMTIIGTNGYF